MDFKDKVRSRRLELGLTLEEVAKIVGVSAPTIQRYETGEIKNVRRDKIKLLSVALQVTPSYLMDWEEMNNENKINNDPLSPIAAHLRGKNISDEKLKRIEKFIEFTLKEDN